MFDHNVVYKVKNGDIANAERFVIDRSKATQKKTYSKTTNRHDYGYGDIDVYVFKNISVF